MKHKLQVPSSNKYKWLYLASPCNIAILFCVYAIIISYFNMDKSGGWSYLGVIIFFPACLILKTFDWIVKLIFGINILSIWLVEIVVIGILAGWFFDRF